jgi:RNA exonuclease 1
MAHRNRQQRTSRLPRPEPHQGPLPLPLACPPGDDYPIELFSLLEPAEVMRKQGYVVAPLGRQDLNMKARCKDCNQRTCKAPLFVRGCVLLLLTKR